MAEHLSLRTFMPYRLAITSSAISDVIAGNYQRQFGLKIPEWRMLAVLGQGEPLSQRDLAHIARTDKVSVNRAIKALCERDLVRRLPSQQDGRSHLLDLTPAGRAMFESIGPVALAMEHQLVSVLSEEECDMLMTTLTKLCDRANQLRGGEGFRRV